MCLGHFGRGGTHLTTSGRLWLREKIPFFLGEDTGTCLMMTLSGVCGDVGLGMMRWVAVSPCHHVPVSPAATHLDLHDHRLEHRLHEVAQGKETAEHWGGDTGDRVRGTSWGHPCMGVGPQNGCWGPLEMSPRGCSEDITGRSPHGSWTPRGVIKRTAPNGCWSPAPRGPTGTPRCRGGDPAP